MVREPSSDNNDSSILPENLVAVNTEATSEAPTTLMVEGRSGDGGGRPRLGSWLVTSWIQQL